MVIIVDLTLAGWYLRAVEPITSEYRDDVRCGLFYRFIAVNRRLSRLVEQRLPQARINPSVVFSRVVAERVQRLKDGAVVLDIGAGRRSVLAGWLRTGIRLVAIDSSANELRANRDADELLLADVCRRTPLDDESVDLLISRHVVEHLPDITAFVRESARVLRPNGWYVHFFPCRFAPFAIFNRLLPRTLTARILRLTSPETSGTERFAAKYHWCWPSEFCRLLNGAGLAVDFTYVSYYGSHYLNFLFPAYLLSITFEMAVMSLKLANLCAYLVIAGRKQGRVARE